jgi:hypothetical protein
LSLPDFSALSFFSVSFVLRFFQGKGFNTEDTEESEEHAEV